MLEWYLRGARYHLGHLAPIDLAPGPASNCAGQVQNTQRSVRVSTFMQVTATQTDRIFEGIVQILDLVMPRVPIGDGLDDLNRIFNPRFFYMDGGKAPLKGGISLDILTVLVDRRCPNARKIATSEGGFELISRILSTISPPAPIKVCISSMKITT